MKIGITTAQAQELSRLFALRSYDEHAPEWGAVLAELKRDPLCGEGVARWHSGDVTARGQDRIDVSAEYVATRLEGSPRGAPGGTACERADGQPGAVAYAARGASVRPRRARDHDRSRCRNRAVRRYAAVTAGLVREGDRMVPHVDLYLFDTMQACVAHLADSVLLGPWPEGIYSLDTGREDRGAGAGERREATALYRSGTNPLRPMGVPESASADAAGAH